jgi:hypothetical protein
LQENWNDSYLNLTEETRDSDEYKIREEALLNNTTIITAQAKQQQNKAVRSEVSKYYNKVLNDMILVNTTKVDQIPAIVEQETSKWPEGVTLNTGYLQESTNEVIRRSGDGGGGKQQPVSTDVVTEDVESTEDEGTEASTDVAAPSDTKAVPSIAELSKETGIPERDLSGGFAAKEKQGMSFEEFVTAVRSSGEVRFRKQIKEKRSELLGSIPELSKETGIPESYLLAAFAVKELKGMTQRRAMAELRGLRVLLVAAGTHILKPAAILLALPTIIGLKGLIKGYDVALSLRDALNALETITNPSALPEKETVNPEEERDKVAFDQIVKSKRASLAYEDDPASSFQKYLIDTKKLVNDYFPEMSEEDRAPMILATWRSLGEVAGDKIETSREIETFLLQYLPYLTDDTKRTLLERQSELQILESRGESPVQKKQTQQAWMFQSSGVAVREQADEETAIALELAKQEGLQRSAPEEAHKFRNMARGNTVWEGMVDHHIESFELAKKDLQGFATQAGIPMHISPLDISHSLAPQIELRIAQVSIMSTAFGNTTLIPLLTDSELALYKQIYEQKSQAQKDEIISSALRAANAVSNIGMSQMSHVLDKDDIVANYHAGRLSDKGFWLNRVPSQEHNTDAETQVSGVMKNMINNNNYRLNSHTYDGMLGTLTRSVESGNKTFKTSVIARVREHMGSFGAVASFLKQGLVEISPGSNKILIPRELKASANRSIEDTLRRDDLFITVGNKLVPINNPQTSDIVVLFTEPKNGIPDMTMAYIAIRDPSTGVPIPLEDANGKRIVNNLRG